MRQLRFWLISLFFIQLLITGGLFWGNYTSTLKNKPTQLLNINWGNIDKFTVEDTVGGITIIKSDDTWLLSNQQLPISDADINKFLYNLMKISL
jgi:hypothetical protein